MSLIGSTRSKSLISFHILSCPQLKTIVIELAPLSREVRKSRSDNLCGSLYWSIKASYLRTRQPPSTHVVPSRRLPDPPDDLACPRFVSARASYALYVETDTLSHLDDAIQHFSDATPLPPSTSAVLSVILAIRYKHIRDPSDLQRVAEIAREAVDAVLTGHSERGEYLVNLALRLRNSYQLRDALGVSQEMQDVVPPPP